MEFFPTETKTLLPFSAFASTSKLFLTNSGFEHSNSKMDSGIIQISNGPDFCHYFRPHLCQDSGSAVRTANFIVDFQNNLFALYAFVHFIHSLRNKLNRRIWCRISCISKFQRILSSHRAFGNSGIYVFASGFFLFPPHPACLSFRIGCRTCPLCRFFSFFPCNHFKNLNSFFSVTASSIIFSCSSETSFFIFPAW